MSWFIVNGISALSAFLSLGIFIITTRKLARTIRLGRELALHIQSTTASLETACTVLREEHQDFRDENRTLAARIGESARIRRELEHSLNHMEKLHLQLQKHLTQQATVLPRAARRASALSQQEQNGLPVFVQRRVSKATLNNTGRF